MPNIGPMELVIILVIALLILGPSRLPSVGESLGKSIREFRKAASDVSEAASVATAPPAPTPPAPVAPAPAPAPNTLAQEAAPNTLTTPGAPAAPAEPVAQAGEPKV